MEGQKAERYIYIGVTLVGRSATEYGPFCLGAGPAAAGGDSNTAARSTSTETRHEVDMRAARYQLNCRRRRRRPTPGAPSGQGEGREGRVFLPSRITCRRTGERWVM